MAATDELERMTIPTLRHRPEVRRLARALSVSAEHPAILYMATLSTAASRRAVLTGLRRIGEAFGKKPAEIAWHTLTYADITMLRAWLGDRFAPNTANLYLSALRGVLRGCVRLGLMTRDAQLSAVDVPPIRGSRIRPGRALERNEIQRLFGAARSRPLALGVRDVALLACIYGAALRRSELAGLELENYQDGAVLVRGKGGRERLVPLPAPATKALDAWIALRGVEPGPLFYRGRKGGAIVPLPLSGTGIYTILQELAALADVPPFSPHDCRRTYIGDLLEAGVDVVTVATLVGHSNVATTQRYDRRPERTRRDAVQRLHLPIDAFESERPAG